jgi:HD-GYP domain-containing protein (c-di-GMP phosphodiesterase class II)
MSQAILISDNQVINSLYEVNLRAYVGTNVTVKESLDAAMSLIEHSPNIDAVICFRELNNEDNAIDKFHTYLTEKGLTIPVIVLGSPANKIANSIVISNKYDIKGLLKAMAKILEITAQDMANRQVPQYFPIPLHLFSQIEKSHCDIFFRTQKDEFEYDYFTILEKDMPVGDSLAKYHQEGVEHLYIDAKERLHFINKASAAVVGELERDDLTDAERVEITEQAMGIVAEEIFENDKVSENVAEISRACVKAIAKVVKDTPKIKNLLKMLVANKTEYVYKHSVVTTYIATEIIKKISWGSVEQQNKVAFALFFHDIYLVPIFQKYPEATSEEDLLFRDDVSEEDKQVVLDHAKLAGNMIKTFPKCPMGADMIVMQHHGMTSGVGFAVNYKDDISPLSKIMIIAEEVCSNILADIDNTEKKFTINMKAMVEHLNERYRNHTYRKIIEAFEQVTL